LLSLYEVWCRCKLHALSCLLRVWQGVAHAVPCSLLAS
jgi:hypothetical protein